tara:strand:- start:7518 stop:7793 length:276 start_codon:yes stop_codon:yes gene_type:complete
MNNKSANQLYKESKSELPFKKWLQQEQGNGVLADHEKMFNADGDELEDDVVIKKPTNKIAKSNLMRNNMIGIAAIGLIIYGLNKYSSQASG